MQQDPISTFSIAVGVVSAIMAMSSVVCLVFHNYYKHSTTLFVRSLLVCIVGDLALFRVL